MVYIPRNAIYNIRLALDRGKSVLLLGARQTGKTTIVQHSFQPAVSISLLNSDFRRKYEQSPSRLTQELQAQKKLTKTMPLVFIDEVQKVPELMDEIQWMIDNGIAQFIITGSSARKLRRGTNINLLPGRVVVIHLDPLSIDELHSLDISLEEYLLFGSLQHIILEKDNAARETDLLSYVSTYLEEEIREEALVRNVGSFANFLELAASESGGMINYSGLAEALGLPRALICSYFEILEDCLVAEKISPLVLSSTRRRLSKSEKYIFFDLGIRRICAKEGSQLPRDVLGRLFEQFIGLNLLYKIRQAYPLHRLCYWRDHNGPEVDYVIVQEKTLIPIEVKLTDKPSSADVRHLKFFCNEYGHVKQAFLICQVATPVLLDENILALPWRELGRCFELL